MKDGKTLNNENKRLTFPGKRVDQNRVALLLTRQEYKQEIISVKIVGHSRQSKACCILF
jgi:hypothetical protein